MSKAVKSYISRDYRERIGDIEGVTVICLRGISAIDTGKIRRRLAKKDIKVTVVRNSLFKREYAESAIAPIAPVLKGASALAYGGNSVVEVAREIVGLLAEFPKIELKGALLDGQLFSGDEGVKELSRFPTREEAISKAIAIVLGPAQSLVAQVKGPGATIAGIIKSIEEKLEKGETIAAKA